MARLGLSALGSLPEAAGPEGGGLATGPRAMVSTAAQANDGPHSPFKNLLVLLL